jgi:hypothetical protein
VAPLLKYTVLRLGLFVVALAALASMLLSYVLLRGPREELAGVIEQRVSARLQRRAAEDAIEDVAAHRAAEAGSARGEPDAEQ